MSSDFVRSIWYKKLTRFELARIVGARALQLSLGAPPLIDPSEAPAKDPIAVAILELLRGVLPITVKRVKPDGEYELLPVSGVLSPDNKRYLETTLKSWTLSTSGWSL
ncbi:MAG: DNA-directed RNA polymerase subunit K [Thermoprotei archaeon]|nr:MAG: DNA-directed RNA polymerase subunit K [Thermoprotei archaeon]